MPRQICDGICVYGMTGSAQFLCELYLISLLEAAFNTCILTARHGGCMDSQSPHGRILTVIKMALTTKGDAHCLTLSLWYI
jgi:hypothetical protein